MDITQLMQKLEDARANLDSMIAEHAALRDEATPAEVKAVWAAIDEEFDPIIEAAQAAYGKAESAVKAAVAEHGETVKGQFLQAVWSKPRVTWDAKSLDGYALNHPELFAFRKEGQPSVSIRVLK